MSTETLLRISIVKVNPSEHPQDESLVEALRPHLHWEMVERDTYYALAQMLPTGTRILIDHHAGRPSVATIDEALAVYAQEQTARQATEHARQASLPARKPKKTVKKGLTARQQRELKTLRNELGKQHG